MGYESYGYDAYTVGIVAIGGILIFIWLIGMALTIFTIICNWKVYKKAGKPGWSAIVPIYNVIVLLEIVDLPLWYIILLCIPFANIYVIFKIHIELAKKFGKDVGFGIGLVFLNPIFMAIIAFSKDCVYGGITTNNTVNYQQVQPQQQPVQNQQPQQLESTQVPPVIPTPQQQPSFCTGCGAPLPVGAKFCTSCGKPVQQ